MVLGVVGVEVSEYHFRFPHIHTPLIIAIIDKLFEMTISMF